MEKEKLNLCEIIVGTNEEFILGFSVTKNKNNDVSLAPSFTNHSHNGRIKQVATSGIYLASGGTDEVIRIFNLRNRTEVGCFHHHNGSVTSLQFHESGFLFSGSEDGKFVILKKGKWEVEKELKGHSRGITGIAVHPSGKLCLSISSDKKMIMWDLMKGKRACVVSLKKVGDLIVWSPKGSHYFIASGNIFDLYAVENGNVVHSIDFTEKIHCCCFINNDFIVIGGEKKSLCLYNVSQKEEIVQWEAHANRTKELIHIESDNNQDVKFIASASSDGFIKVWCINLSCIRSAPTLLGQVDTKCRIICMALSYHPPVSQLRSHSPEVSSNMPSKKKAKISCTKEKKKCS